jgi:hypothetical protein
MDTVVFTCNPRTQRLKQEHHEFQASLGYTAKLTSKHQKEEEKGKGNKRNKRKEGRKEGKKKNTSK